MAQIDGYDDLIQPGGNGGHDADIAQTLLDEAQAMSSREVSNVIPLFDEDVTGIDGRHVTTPATWKISSTCFRAKSSAGRFRVTWIMGWCLRPWSEHGSTGNRIEV